jgi:AcrR family transcriptional regulator
VTFYKHYCSPAEVLNACLERELATARAHFLANATTRPETTEETLVATAHLVLDHVERNRAIYLLAIGVPQDGTVPNMLANHFAGTLQQYLAQHPELTPPDSDLNALISIRFMSRGLAGAVEAWLLSGTTDRNGFIDATLTFVPEWLFRTHP